MGFRINRTYVLEFEEPLAGAEVRIRSTSIGTMLKLRNADTVEEVAALLADHLEDWNFEDAEGNTLPTTLEGIHQLEAAVLVRIGREWYRAAAGVTAPLEDSTSVEVGLPMDVETDEN